MGWQTLENKALSRGIIGKSAPILAEITIRKSQDLAHELYPKSISKSAFLETLLEYGLENLDTITSRLTELSESEEASS